MISFIYFSSCKNYNIHMGGSCPGKTKNDIEPEYHRNMYFFQNIVGKGGFGKVWKVQLKKNREVYALKIMSKAKILAKRSVQSVMNEKCFLQTIDNKFIINMVAAFQDRENLYLAMDYLSGGDLRYYINRKAKFTQADIKFIMRCIIEGLRYLHDISIIHRDIKPENIVFQQTGYCRITDLGVAREWRAENSSETSGTPGYMAPQVMCKQNHSFCADYFAVGVICFQLMMGYRPYQGSTRKAIRDEILAKQVQIPDSCPYFSKQMIDFTNRLIQRKVKNRLGYNGIHQLLQHPWIKMNASQQFQFQNKSTKPLFVPLKDRNHDRIIQDTEPSDIQRQNALLLKKDTVQQMFRDYDYIKTGNLNNTKNLDDTKASISTSDHKSKGSISQNFAKIDI